MFDGLKDVIHAVQTGGARIYTLNDCFDILTEIRDELRALNSGGRSMPFGGATLEEPGRAVTNAVQQGPGVGVVRDRASEAILGANSFSVRFSEAVAQYLEQKQHEVSPQHLDIVRLTLNAFGNCLPVAEVTGVDRQHVVAYRYSLLDSGRAVKTVNNALAILGAFFSWATEMGYLADNPATGLKLKDRTRVSRKRKAFTPEQIQHVFEELRGGGGRTIDGYAKVWLPLIMLYTGARPEEIAQLRVGDIYEGQRLGPCVEGTPTWVFDFSTMDDGQRRKNEASRRLVPVHPRLWELGLRRLLGTLDEQLAGHKRPNAPLFPELKPGANGRLAEAPSRWFNRVWLREVVGISDSKLVLYSLRHSVATHLKHVGVAEPLIAQLLGHTNSSMTTGRYGKEYPIEKLAAAVAKLDWKV
jgi:integrase